MEPDVCGICRDVINEPTKIQECSHVFCFACISQWCNVSNSCPLCQKRFLHLCRTTPSSKSAQNVKVRHVDKRMDNWMQVMEEYDSEEQSIHTSDDEEEEAEGSEADCYEPDFVVPDNVIVYEDGQIVDLGNEMATMNPFGKTPKGQKDSIIKTSDGQIITITWARDEPISSNVAMSEDSDGEFKIENEQMSVSSEGEDIDDEEEDDEDDDDRTDQVIPEGARVLYRPRRQ